MPDDKTVDLTPEQREALSRVAQGVAKDMAGAVHAAAHQLHDAVEQLRKGGSGEEFMAVVVGTAMALGMVIQSADRESYSRLKMLGVELPPEVEAHAKAAGYDTEPREYRNEPGKRPMIVMPEGRA